MDKPKGGSGKNPTKPNPVKQGSHRSGKSKQPTAGHHRGPAK